MTFITITNSTEFSKDHWCSSTFISKALPPPSAVPTTVYGPACTNTTALL